MNVLPDLAKRVWNLLPLCIHTLLTDIKITMKTQQESPTVAMRAARKHPPTTGTAGVATPTHNGSAGQTVH